MSFTPIIGMSVTNKAGDFHRRKMTSHQSSVNKFHSSLKYFSNFHSFSSPCKMYLRNIATIQTTKYTVTISRHVIEDSVSVYSSHSSLKTSPTILINNTNIALFLLTFLLYATCTGVDWSNSKHP